MLWGKVLEGYYSVLNGVYYKVRAGCCRVPVALHRLGVAHENLPEAATVGYRNFPGTPVLPRRAILAGLALAQASPAVAGGCRLHFTVWAWPTRTCRRLPLGAIKKFR